MFLSSLTVMRCDQIIKIWDMKEILKEKGEKDYKKRRKKK